jgi:hypothetical protein
MHRRYHHYIMLMSTADCVEMMSALHHADFNMPMLQYERLTCGMIIWKKWVVKWTNNEVTCGTPRRHHVAPPKGHHMASLQHDRWHLHIMLIGQEKQMEECHVAQSQGTTWHPMYAH